MKFLMRLSWAIVVTALFAEQAATAAEFYVHPEGNDANPGTFA